MEGGLRRQGIVYSLDTGQLMGGQLMGVPYSCEQVNQLLSAFAEESHQHECLALLHRLQESLAKHFADEEAILSGTEFPFLEHHAQCHKMLLNKAYDMSARLEKGEGTAGELFGFFAYEVIARHLIDEDRKFFPYL